MTKLVSIAGACGVFFTYALDYGNAQTPQEFLFDSYIATADANISDALVKIDELAASDDQAIYAFSDYILNKILQPEAEISISVAESILGHLSETYWKGEWRSLGPEKSREYASALYSLYEEKLLQNDSESQDYLTSLDNIIARSPDSYMAAMSIILSASEQDSYQRRRNALLNMRNYYRSSYMMRSAIEYSDSFVEESLISGIDASLLRRAEAVLCRMLDDPSCFCLGGTLERCPIEAGEWTRKVDYYLSEEEFFAFGPEIFANSRDAWRWRNDIVFRVSLLRILQGERRSENAQRSAEALSNWKSVGEYEEYLSPYGPSSQGVPADYIDLVFLDGLWSGIRYGGLTKFVDVQLLGSQLDESIESGLLFEDRGSTVLLISQSLNQMEFPTWTVYAGSFLSQNEANSALDGLRVCFREQYLVSEEDWEGLGARVTPENASGYSGVVFGRYTLIDSERRQLEVWLEGCGYGSYWVTRKRYY